MKVNQVSANYNTQPAFKGSINKNVSEYISQAVRNEVDDIVEIANRNSEKADMQKIIDVKAIGQALLEKLTHYMSKTNKGTELSLLDQERFILQNSLVPEKTIWIGNSLSEKNSYIDNKFGVHILLPISDKFAPANKASKKDLDILNKIANALKKINPKDIDNQFLNFANEELKTKALKSTGFFQKIKVRNYAKKVDELAQSIGEEQSAKVRAEKYLEKALELKQERQARKELAKQNRKAADKILNG